ncbi:LysM peptidoglycan-binding domain-containing protein [Limibacter armeniacum]|uniref:LysM peptidoglycan-binding domain-containing protein n=1 Tax=Limibacter armeniacum TaxID=466084 RepID=UPI002FE52CCD
MRTPKKITLLWVATMLFSVSSVFAQDENPAFTWEDSIYTVPPPEGYIYPFDTLEVVEAAPYAPWTEDALEDFDTTSVVHLDNILMENDYIPHPTDDIIMDRLACIESDIPLTYHERVRKFIDYFTVRNRDYTMLILQRKNMYFPMFERIFREEGVPEELKYLAIIESALKPTALSRVGARGLWQFMPRTGLNYGLKQNSHFDERMNPEKATRAAAKYLRFLYNYFHDWELALAAYNCGPGNIRKAQRRSEKFHFWDIYHKLPRETRSYLPQFVAMMYALNYADEHNLIQEQPFYEIPTEEVLVSQSVDLKKLAEQLMVCDDDLKELNPQVRWGYIPDGIKNYPIKIPALRKEMFDSNRDSILAKSKYDGKSGSYLDGFYYHYVRRGESLGLIAQRNRVRVWEIKAWNNLRGNTIYAGQKLKIYGRGHVSPQQKTASRSSSSNAKVNASGYHTIRSGENLGAIAKRYGVSITQLRSWNNLRGNTIYAGKKLIVAVDKAKKSNSSVSSSSVKKSTASSKPVSNGYYTVKSGDTLWEIAKNNGVSVNDIKKWNGLKSNSLRPGQKLLIKS